MSDNRIGVGDYLSGAETLRRRELVWGLVREPPAPRFGHQSVVTTISHVLTTMVYTHRLGFVCVSPIDVVLDNEKALIVQPDVVFVSHQRRDIIRGQIWGAPDLVVEVTSPRTARYDRTTKLRWYRQYGVLECWLVDPARRSVDVIDLAKAGPRAVRRFAGDRVVQSRVLPGLTTSAAEYFAPSP